jgi:hypothetical protein
MGAARLFLEKLMPLVLKNFLKMTVSVHFLDDGLMDSNYIWYTGARFIKELTTKTKN